MNQPGILSDADRFLRLPRSTALTRMALAFALLFTATGAAELTGAAAGIGGRATGFFHLESLRGRQFLVTPEGRPFVALGLNHCSDETTGTAAGQEAVLANLQAWGFNTGDYGLPAWMRNRLPHPQGITLIPNSAWMTPDQFGFRDVFDPAFLAELERTIRQACEPQRDNPLLIGYFFTDVPRWGLAPAQTTPDESLVVLPAIGPQNWVAFFKALPAAAPGRKEWAKWKSDHPAAEEEDFLPVIARQLYGQAHAFIRRYDSNHLIFGDRYLETDMPEAVVREALPFIDGLAIQPVTEDFDPAFYTALAKKYGKPIYLGDHVTSFRTAEFPRTMGPRAESPEAYLAFYRRYLTAALAHPAIVGHNRCQYRSRIRSPGNPPLLKQGLLQLDGRPYPAVIEGVSAINRAALAAAYGP